MPLCLQAAVRTPGLGGNCCSAVKLFSVKEADFKIKTKKM